MKQKEAKQWDRAQETKLYTGLLIVQETQQNHVAVELTVVHCILDMAETTKAKTIAAEGGEFDFRCCTAQAVSTMLAACHECSQPVSLW